MIRERRRLAVGLAIGMAAVGLTATTQSASATTLSGYDISWPQCSVAQGGFGNPMPPTTTGFVVIGLTDGHPFSDNPCLADQLAWATTNHVTAAPYTMSGFPTPAQITTYGASGPWSAATRAGQLSNAGYAEAVDLRQGLTSVGWAPTQVWVDVEPLSSQPWATTTAAHRENRFVLEGLMRGLHDGGLGYGLYSNLNGWQTITGTWRLPGVPAWATSGPSSSATALAKCSAPAVSAGKVYLSQWWDSQFDYDLACSPYAFGALPHPASTLSNSTGDFNGDWNNDLLARVRSTGDLRLYAGTGTGRVASGVRIGTGWNGFDVLETAGDLDSDGTPDLLARQASTGYLWRYPTDGAGHFKSRVRVGTGWNVMSHLVGAGDLNGDQKADLLAVERSTGYLWLYPGNGVGGWSSRVRAGTGLGGFDSFVAPGDVNGDGISDLLIREHSTGYLWLYPGSGHGGWLSRVRVGTGFGAMNLITSPGDLNGDRVPDLLARDTSGVLWMYPGKGAAGFGARVQVGASWSSIDQLF
jgi:hypothetical protein